MHCSAVFLIAQAIPIINLPWDWSLNGDSIHNTWEACPSGPAWASSSDEAKIRGLAKSTDTVPLVILDFGTLAQCPDSNI
jgi:hypothetical protein